MSLSAVLGAIWPLAVLVAGAAPALAFTRLRDDGSRAHIVEWLPALPGWLQADVIGAAVLGCILVALVGVAVRIHRQRRLAA